MRTATVLLTVLLYATAYAAPKSAKLAKATTPTSKPTKAPEAFYVVTCASQCLSTPKSVRLTWSDGWSAPDAKKLQRDLARTCVADLLAADCKKPACSCVAKLAVPASQPASRPATTQPVSRLLLPRAGSNMTTQDSIDKRSKQSSKATASRGDDLPRPGETRVEVTP